MISLGLGLLLYVLFRWFHYIKIIFKVKKPGAKAILDSLLADVHLNLWKKYNQIFQIYF